MFTFYFCEFFSCVKIMFKTQMDFKVSTIVFFALFIAGITCAIYIAVKKPKKQFADNLFVIYLIYFFADTVIGLNCYNRCKQFGVNPECAYSSSLLRFAVLSTVYAVCYLINYLTESQMEKKDKENQLSPFVVGASEKKTYKLLEKDLSVCEIYDPTSKNPIDLNVSYLLAIIDELFRRDLSLDDKLWLEDLTISVKQAYSFKIDEMKIFNQQLEKLIKKITEYDVTLG